jgi:hypothetical protein
LVRVILHRCYKTGEEINTLYSTADQLSVRRCSDQHAPCEEVVRYTRMTTRSWKRDLDIKISLLRCRGSRKNNATHVRRDLIQS